ncbi:Vacuolar protein sorting-associated protein VTA1 [Sphaceloma murrayae]|uniref:Vacuolar protein sorting-associated protein VTA1 n=1 Tax=Sphaceloma murrayae TaxID=2082308 RepID=A0A2K1QZF2_9PEZI|nr:Vacuolar protein sorting-associated protein VTA1 [Sphaceloma murrayae]
MAAALPAKLKVPGITPYATRAAQLERFRPIVSYWCNYQIVQQILAKNLHAIDDECRDYTMALMDKLEVAKNQSPPVDAIVDDIAAKAYIEQFALETFQKADDAIHTDKASKQTIDTFQASSTFLELLSIWTNPLDAETTSKIKYAKYHALRIAKAIKAGEDPNASNPKDDPPPIASPDIAGPSDQMQIDSLQPPGLGETYRPPTVESAPESMLPSRTGSIPPQAPALISPPAPDAAQNEPDVSPIEPVEEQNSRHGSVGGGYFPAVPTFTSESSAPTVPTANPDILPGNTQTAAPLPPQVPFQDTQSPQNFYTQHPPQPPPQAFSPPPAPVPHHASLPAPASISHPIPQPAPGPPPPSLSSAPVVYKTDDEAVAQAQKHAKWAISALNFEDVNTAVKELRIALRALGAS